jgi:hypothetical protein
VTETSTPLSPGKNRNGGVALLELLRVALVCAAAAFLLSSLSARPRSATAVSLASGQTPSGTLVAQAILPPGGQKAGEATQSPAGGTAKAPPSPPLSSPTPQATLQPATLSARPTATPTSPPVGVGRPTGLPQVTPKLATPLPVEPSRQPTTVPARVTPTARAPAKTPAAQGECPTLMCRLLRQLFDMSTLPFSEETTQKQYASNNHSSPERFWDYFNSDALFSRDLRYGYSIGGGQYARYRIVTGYDGRTEYEVLPRTEGPGYVARVWFTHRQHDRPEPNETPDPEWGFFAEAGNIRFYFDDEPTPRVDMPVTQFFGGNSAPFLAPLVSYYRTADGGNISYVPMPFRKSVRAALAPAVIPENGKYVGPRMFQIAVKRFTADPGPFETFQLSLDQEETALLEQVRQAWNRRGAHPYPSDQDVALQRFFILAPRAPESVHLGEPGTITTLKLLVPDNLEGGLELRISWDGAETPAVSGPLRALFGTAEGLRRYRSLPVGIIARQSPDGRRQNEFYNYFPMPYKSADIVVVNNGGEPVPVQVDIAYRPGEPAPRRFHALFKTQRMTVDDQENYVAMDVAGSGRYVGLIFTGHDVDRSGQPYYREPLPDVWRFPYLEGNVDLWVDGELTMPGTGAEDDFNGGYYYIWYNPNGLDSVQYALSGCTWKDAASLGEVASQYRFYLSDSVEFKRSFRMEIEHGIMDNNLSATYSSTAFWYQ